MQYSTKYSAISVGFPQLFSPQNSGIATDNNLYECLNYRMKLLQYNNAYIHSSVKIIRELFCA